MPALTADALRDLVSRGGLTADARRQCVAAFAREPVSRLRYLLGALGLPEPTDKADALSRLDGHLAACMAGDLTTGSVGAVSAQEKTPAPEVEAAAPAVPAADPAPAGKSGAGKPGAGGAVVTPPVSNPAAKPAADPAAADIADAEKAQKSASLSEDYWDEVILAGGQPRRRQDVQAEMTAAGVPADLIEQYQRECAVFGLRGLAAAAVGVLKKADQKLGSIGSKGHGGHGEGEHGGHEGGHGEGEHAGGKDEGSCHWITISGAKGTTHICIDGAGTIVKGPSGMTGKSAKTVLGKAHHESADAAMHKSRDKDAAAKQGEHGKDDHAGGGHDEHGHDEHGHARGDQPRGDQPRGDQLHEAHGATHADAQHHGSQAGHRIGEMAEHLETAIHFLLHPGAAAASVAASKVLGGRLGFVKEKIHHLEGKIRARYGEPAGTMIVVAGIAGSFAGGMALPGIGHVLAPALPGTHLVAALPFMAVAEVIRAGNKAVKAGGPALRAGLDKMRAAAASFRSALSGQRPPTGLAPATLSAEPAFGDEAILAAFAAELAFSDAPLCDVPRSVLESEGKRFWDEVQSSYVADLKAHEKDLKAMTDAMVAAARGGAKGAKGDAKGDAKVKGPKKGDASADMADFLFDLEARTVTLSAAVRVIDDLVAGQPLEALRRAADRPDGDAVACADGLVAHFGRVVAGADQLRLVPCDGLPVPADWLVERLTAGSAPAEFCEAVLSEPTWAQRLADAVAERSARLAARRLAAPVEVPGVGVVSRREAVLHFAADGLEPEDARERAESLAAFGLRNLMGFDEKVDSTSGGGWAVVPRDALGRWTSAHPTLFEPKEHHADHLVHIDATGKIDNAGKFGSLLGHRLGEDSALKGSEVGGVGLRGSRTEVEAAHAIFGPLAQRLRREAEHIKSNEPYHQKLNTAIDHALGSLTDATRVRKAKDVLADADPASTRTPRDLLAAEAAAHHPEEVGGSLLHDRQGHRFEPLDSKGRSLPPSREQLDAGVMSGRMAEASGRITDALAHATPSKLDAVAASVRGMTGAEAEALAWKHGVVVPRDATPAQAAAALREHVGRNTKSTEVQAQQIHSPADAAQHIGGLVAKGKDGTLGKGELEGSLAALGKMPKTSLDRLVSDLGLAGKKGGKPKTKKDAVERIARHVQRHAEAGAVALHVRSGLDADDGLDVVVYDGLPRTRGFVAFALDDAGVPAAFAADYLVAAVPFEVAVPEVAEDVCATGWVAPFARSLSEGQLPRTLDESAVASWDELAAADARFGLDAEGIVGAASALADDLAAGRVPREDFAGRLRALLGPAAFHAARSARGGHLGLMTDAAWSLAAEQSGDLLACLTGLARPLAAFADDADALAEAGRQAVRYAAVLFSDYQEHRRLFAREQGAVRERRLVPPSGACCRECAAHADAGWVGMGLLPAAGDCACATDCRCRFAFSRDGDGGGVDFDGVPPDASWGSLYDRVFFAWDETARVRIPKGSPGAGRFMSFHEFVGKVYDKMKMENKEAGMQPPTRGELMERVQGRMKNWSEDKFGQVLGKAVDKSLISAGIHSRQPAAAGENFVTKALAHQLQGAAAAKQDPATLAGGGLLKQLANLSQPEAQYVHAALGLTPVPGSTGKLNLALQVNNYLKANSGDTPRANAVAGLIGRFAEKDAPTNLLDDVPNIKATLAQMSDNELGHVAGKLGLADTLPTAFVDNSKAAGLSPGQMVLARAGGDAAKVAGVIGQNLDAAAATLAQAKSAEIAQALDAKVGPLVAPLKEHLADPDLSQADAFKGQILALGDAEAVHLGKLVGLLDKDPGVPGVAQSLIAGAMQSATDAKVQANEQKIYQLAYPYQNKIANMEVSGDYSKGPELIKALQAENPKVAEEVAKGVTGLSYVPGSGTALAAIAGHLEAQHKSQENAKVDDLQQALYHILQSPYSFVTQGGDQKSLAPHLESLKTLSPVQLQSVAAHLGVSIVGAGGSNGIVKAITSKLTNAVQKVLDKQKEQKLAAQTAASIDCAKKLYWGHPAKECGGVADVVGNLMGMGANDDAILYAYGKLQKELKLPALLGQTPEQQGGEANKNLVTALKAKVAEAEAKKPIPLVVATPEMHASVDCAKKLYWGKPAAGCGGLTQTLLGIKKQGPAAVAQMYAMLDNDLKLPKLTATDEAGKAIEALDRLAGALAKGGAGEAVQNLTVIAAVSQLKQLHADADFGPQSKALGILNKLVGDGEGTEHILLHVYDKLKSPLGLPTLAEQPNTEAGLLQKAIDAAAYLENAFGLQKGSVGSTGSGGAATPPPLGGPAGKLADCAKKLFWGHPAGDCGSVATVMQDIAGLSSESIVAVHGQLQQALGLPPLPPGMFFFQAQAAKADIAGALASKAGGTDPAAAKVQQGIDCAKKLYWGHPAKECGGVNDVLDAISQGPDHVLAAYAQLQGELGLPELKSSSDLYKSNEAVENLYKALEQKVGDAPPAAGYKALPDIGPALAGLDLSAVEPTWSKAGLPGASQMYGGVVFSPDGRILLRQEGHGGWAIPKSSPLYSSNGAVEGVTGKIAAKTGVTGTVVGLVPGTFTGTQGHANYFVMQAKDSQTVGSSGKWATPAEAKALLTETLQGVPSKLKKELAVLDAAIAAHDKLLAGGKQMPKGVKSQPTTADDVAALVPVKSLGGSTGAQLVADADGNEYVLKKGASAAHVREEAAADAAYAAAGLPVPKAKLIDTPGGPVKLADYIPGLVPIDQALAQAESKKDAAGLEKLTLAARAGFVLDAVLGNWDVVGASFDNMQVAPDGTVYRLDNGGSLRYRAMGAKKEKKDFGPSVPEMESLRDGTNKNASKIFGGITDGELSEQAKNLVAKKSSILAALPAELRDVVSKRIDYVATNYIKAPEVIPGNVMTLPHGGGKWPGGSPGKVTPYHATPEELAASPSFKVWGDDEPRANITEHDLPASYKKHVAATVATVLPTERTAMANYTGSGYHPLNKAMRKCPEKLDCLSPSEKTKARKLESALAKQGVLETPLTVWRHFGLDPSQGSADFLPLMQQAMAKGKAVRIPGFKSCSTSPTKNMGFGSGKTVRYALEIKAKTGGFVKAMSGASSEDEFLQPHGVKYKVTGIKEITYKGDYGDTQKRTTFQLEEV